MENIRNGNKVKKICDGITTYFHLKDYVMFEDNFITKHDKMLCNENGEYFNILDVQEVEEHTLVMPEIMPFANGWAFRTVSCVKLDKNVNAGDVLFIADIYNNEKLLLSNVIHRLSNLDRFYNFSEIQSQAGSHVKWTDIKKIIDDVKSVGVV
jgi:hypothetical protein